MKKYYHSIAGLFAVKSSVNKEVKILPGEDDKNKPSGFNVLRILICLVLLQCAAASVFAQPGTLDPSFGQGGKVIPKISGFIIGDPKAMALQSDGKTVITCDIFHEGRRDFVLGAIRLNIDGSLDQTFGVNGLTYFYLHMVVGVYSTDLAIQADGKILVSATLNSPSGSAFGAVRFNTNGTPDNSFGQQVFGGFGGLISSEENLGLNDLNLQMSLAIQHDGKILLAGRYAEDIRGEEGTVEVLGPNYYKVVRFDINGSQDYGFGNSGVALFEVGEFGELFDIKVQPNGKIVLVGNSRNGSNSDFTIVRLNADGTPDSSFGTNGKATVDFGPQDYAFDFAFQTDGKIVVVGYCVNPEETIVNADYAVARLNADGALDSSFDSDGQKIIAFSSGDDIGSSIVIQSDGRILITGTVNTGGSTVPGDLGIVRLNENGSFDTGFDDDGKIVLDFNISYNTYARNNIMLQPDGKIIVSHADHSQQGLFLILARLLNDSETIPTTSITETDPTFITYGEESVIFSSNIFPDPEGGTVQFYINGNPEGSPVPVISGTASLTYNPSALNAGVYLIRADFSGNGAVPAATGSVDTLTINKATPTIIYEAADNLMYDGTAKTGSGIATGVLSSAGILPSVTLTYAGTGATSYGPDNIAPKDAGTYRITANFPGTTNYESFTDSAVEFTIIPIPITILADAQSKTYGDIDPGFSADVTAGSIVSGDEVTGTLSREAGENVGSHTINQGSYTYGTNYSETFEAADLSITPRAITITADASSKVYGDIDPILSAKVTTGNIVAGDAVSGTLSRTPGENVGTYALGKGNYTYGINYSETFLSADLNVTTRAITITADAKSKAFGDIDPVLTARVTTGNIVSGDLTSGMLSRIPGENVGTYLISKGDYTYGPNYTESFNAANLTITLQQVESFTLVNADNDQDIQTLTNGAVLNLATLPTQNLNIRANATPSTVGRVVLALTGSQRLNKTDTSFPYSLFGDVNGDYSIWTAAVGNYTLKATPFTASTGGISGTPLTISFSIVNQSGTNQIPVASAGADKSITLPQTRVVLSGSGSDPENGSNIKFAWTQISGPNTATFSSTSVQTPTVSGLLAGDYIFRLVTKDLLMASSLPDDVKVTVNPAAVKPKLVNFSVINADTDQAIFTLNNGTVLNLATLPTRNLNIRANTFPETISGVSFTLSGTQSHSRTDITLPYALFGDIDGDFTSWVPAVGSYTLKAIPFVNTGGGSLNGTALSIKFKVVNNPVALATTQMASLSGLQVNTTMIDQGQTAMNPDFDKIRLSTYPNPFGKRATIQFTIPTDEHIVNLDVFDLKGSRIASLYNGKGEANKTLRFDFDGSRLSAGVYLLRLSTSKNVEHLKIIMTE